MTSKVYSFEITVAVKDWEVIDSWGECEGKPLTGLQESIDYGDFEDIALRKYREWMEGQAEDAADKMRGR